MNEQTITPEMLGQFEVAVTNMAVIHNKMQALQTIVVDILEIVVSNADDDAEIGRRVKRVFEDYAAKVPVKEET